MRQDISESHVNALEVRVWRLERQRDFVIATVVFLLLGGLGIWGANRELNRMRAVSVAWTQNDDLFFSVVTDGPLVVTHLVHYGNNEGEKVAASLSPSLAILDSYGAKLDKVQIAKLRWLNIYGNEVKAPEVGSEIQALYFRPELSKIR